MKTQMKRILSGALAAVMMLALVSCGSKPASSTPAASQPAASSTPAASEPADEGFKFEKDITVIVPFNPGGDTDVNARLYAERLSDILGVNVVVQNINGNGGAAGATEAYNAKNDGRTVLFYHTALVTNFVSGATDFGVDGFELACIAGRNAGNLVCVKGDSPYQTLEDLLKASNEGNVTFAANAGATTYLMGALLNKAGGNLNLVDMGGASERVAALLGGQVDAIPNPLGTAIQYVESGDFRALALLENERNGYHDEFLTAKEQGIDCAAPIYYFFAFPKGTDAAIVEAFAAACEEVNATADYAEALEASGYAQEVFFEKGEDALKIMLAQQDEQLGMKDLLA